MYRGEILKCVRCHHEWICRLDRRPIQCPKCTSRKWDEERTVRVNVRKNKNDKPRTELMYDMLMEMFDYNPHTGVLTRKIDRHGAKAGSEAGYFTGNGNGSLALFINGREYLVHHIIIFMMTGFMPNGIVKHADKDNSNNEWLNLRYPARSGTLEDQIEHLKNWNEVHGKGE